MKKFLLIGLVLYSLVSIFSCGTKDDKTTHKTEEPVNEERHENSDQVSLTAEQMRTIHIELGGIEQKQLTASLKTNGVLKVPNQNKASVSSVYSGVIKSLLVQPGNIVSKEQTIATIANPEFIQVQSDYIATKSKIVLAQQEYDRQKELNAGNAGALKNLQAAESNLKALLTLRSSLSQQIQLMGINPSSLSDGKFVSVLAIRSPIGGVVSNVMVKMGSYVNVSTAVAEIVDNSRLHLDLFVFEKDLPKLKNNQTIHFNITNNPAKEYDAKIFSLGSSFEGDSKTVSVHALVEGDKTGLIDGMNVTAVISLNQVTVPAVPSEAIITVGGQDYIFVAMDDKPVGDSTGVKTQAGQTENEMTFQRVPVAKGSSDIGYTEITLLKEIGPNAKIVIKGAFFVSAKMTNTEGHDD